MIYARSVSLQFTVWYKHVFSGTDLQAMARNINYELEHISLWLKVKKLSLSVKKTHYMVFTYKKSRIANLKI